jgi:hypothetical protein
MALAPLNVIGDDADWRAPANALQSNASTRDQLVVWSSVVLLPDQVLHLLA